MLCSCTYYLEAVNPNKVVKNPKGDNNREKINDHKQTQILESQPDVIHSVVMIIAVLDVPKDLSIGSVICKNEAYRVDDRSSYFNCFCQEQDLDGLNHCLDVATLFKENYSESEQEVYENINSKQYKNCKACSGTSSNHREKKCMVGHHKITR